MFDTVEDILKQTFETYNMGTAAEKIPSKVNCQLSVRASR